jgi:hypothetical protein
MLIQRAEGRLPFATLHPSYCLCGEAPNRQQSFSSGFSIAAVCSFHDGREVAAADAQILQFPIGKLIELVELSCSPLARRQF